MSTSSSTRSDEGVQLVQDDQGVRSTTPVTRSVVAEALGAVDAAAGARAGAAKEWRTSYLEHVVAMTAAGARSAEASLTIARTGLDALRDRTVLVRDGQERPVAEALREPGTPLGTTTLQGEGARQHDLAVPYRGEVLRGDALRRQLDAWVAAGTVEPSFRTAVGRVLDSPELARPVRPRGRRRRGRRGDGPRGGAPRLGRDRARRRRAGRAGLEPAAGDGRRRRRHRARAVARATCSARTS